MPLMVLFRQSNITNGIRGRFFATNFNYVIRIICLIIISGLLFSQLVRVQFNSDIPQNVITEESPKLWRVYANHSECEKPAVHHRIKTNVPALPITALLSLQGSGNTWIRWLIERMTGICTGSIYAEKLLKVSGFKCELSNTTDGRTIVQKTHYHQHHPANRVLLLVRYPLDAIIADFHRSHSAGSHVGIADKTYFSTPDWKNFALVRFDDWLEQILIVLQTIPDFHVVFYENLKTNLAGELKKIANFLQVFVSPSRMSCVLNNSVGYFKRPPRKNKNERAYFSWSQLEMNNLVVARAVRAFEAKKIADIPVEYLNTASAVRKQLGGY